MIGVDVSQQSFFFGKLFVAVSAEDWLQLKMNGAQMSIEITWKKKIHQSVVRQVFI